MNELDVMWIVGVPTGMMLTVILKDLFKSIKEEKESKRELMKIEGKIKE